MRVDRKFLKGTEHDKETKTQDFSDEEIKDAIKTTYRYGYGGEIRSSDIGKYFEKLEGKSFETIQALHYEIKTLLIAENHHRGWDPEKAKERISKSDKESLNPARSSTKRNADSELDGSVRSFKKR